MTASAKRFWLDRHTRQPAQSERFGRHAGGAAHGGARSFYEGDVAQALAKDVQAKGGSLSVEDLAGYRAWIGAALPVEYRDAMFHVMPGLTAGPTLPA